MGQEKPIGSISHAEAQVEEVQEPLLLEKGAALVFVRRASNVVIGHVGWGFRIHPGELPTRSASSVTKPHVWSVGAVENPTGWLFARPGSDGFWKRPTADPLSIMINLGYDQYKIIPVVPADIRKAQEAEEVIRNRDYSVALINCMNDVYDVLTAYGAADLPNPNAVHNWLPNTWFDHIEAPLFSVDNISGLEEF
jgi:hypothetical protein